jgi:hypothetical protein
MLDISRVIPTAFLAVLLGACLGPSPTPCTDCQGQCVDLQVDSRNCGACGTVCGAGSVCQAGSCMATCPASQRSCSGQCVDVQTDRRHCGACGTVCGDGQLCTGGACVATCGAGQTPCNGACVTLASDSQNCGACGTACMSGQVCTQGQCVTACPTGQTTCSGACVDTQRDVANCGACGMACPSGQVCRSGTCATSCQAGQTVCSGACVDTQRDPSNCGACAMACAAGQVCQAGACATSCPAGRLVCSMACVDPQTDPANCGTCGEACATVSNAASRVCTSGRCDFTQCQSGFADCDSNRANGCERAVSADDANCGGCGVVCNPANVDRVDGGAPTACVNGACTLTGRACRYGFANCDGVDSNGCEAALATDRANCGACGAVCGAGRQCENGLCTPVGATRPRLSLISPFDPTVSSPSVQLARPVVVSLGVDYALPDAGPGGGLIYYRTDGRPVIVGQPGTLVADGGAIIDFGSDAGVNLVRFFTVNAAGTGREPEREYAALAATPSPVPRDRSGIADAVRFTATGGPIGISAPGASVTGTYRLQTWHSDTAQAGAYCPGCIVSTGLSLDPPPVAGVGQADCFTYGGGQRWPGQTATRPFTFTAPSVPGTYPLRYGIIDDFVCRGGGGIVGYLIVR